MKKRICNNCKYANQGTGDFREGMIFCKFLGGVRTDLKCSVTTTFGDTLYEKYDGKNGEW